MTAWSGKSRTSKAYVCQECGDEFHPLYTSKRLYCSVQCNGRAARFRAERLRRAKAGAIAGAMTDKDVADFIKSLDPLPSEYDEEEDDLWKF